VVVALCGVCAGPDGPWALVTLAAHPGGWSRSVVVEHAAADAGGIGVTAGTALRGTLARLAVDLGEDARLDVELCDAVPFRARALGLAHLVPGLPQYWQPLVLAADVRGGGRLGGVDVGLDGATAYVEKNWGGAFQRRWWWGQAGDFGGAPVSVAFAGGPIALAGARVSPSAVVARVGGTVLRVVPPLGRSRVAVGSGEWRVRARGPGVAIDLEGDARGLAPHELLVPIPGPVRTEPRSRQHLAGRLGATIRRGRRTLFAGESALAGLELGG
jgi:tocopherol cyclase